MLEALLHPDRSRPWADRSGETQLDLVAHAHRVAALLDPRGRRVVLSCRRARSFLPGMLGAWLAGATVELLPNVQPGTLDRVDADDGIAHVLHDVAERQARSHKAIYVPEVIDGDRDRSAAAAVPARPWPTIAATMTTSGTTEQPRTIGKTMAQLTGELSVLATVIAPAQCVLSTVPLSHFYGLLWGALLPLRFGARIVSHDALLPADIAAVIERAGVDLMVSTPAHLRAMAAARMPHGLRVITSGARMPADLHISLAGDLGWHVTDVLGSTETGGIATRSHPMAGWAPLRGVAVSAPDEQLVVESPWCDDGRAVLDDRVEVRPDGAFHYLGRGSDVIKIAGKRAHVAALEATALAVAGVTDAAIAVHAPAGREPRVALAVCAGDGAAIGRDAIAAAIRRQFDAVFVPRIVRIVPRIPRTERGKLDTAALRALLGLDETAAPIDRIPVTRVGDGSYAADIPHDLVFFRGHFDALAVLPGAVLVERVVWPVVIAEWPAIAALRGIRRLRFRRPVFPGQQLAVRVARDPAESPDRVTFQVSSASSPVASGQLLVE